MSEHECQPVYVVEGEYVCFECGAVYAFHGKYDAETLAECRQVIAERKSRVPAQEDKP